MNDSPQFPEVYDIVESTADTHHSGTWEILLENVRVALNIESEVWFLARPASLHIAHYLTKEEELISLFGCRLLLKITKSIASIAISSENAISFNAQTGVSRHSGIFLPRLISHFGGTWIRP